MRAKVTQASLESWCGAWSPNDPTCAQSREIDDRLYEARANCETGDLWTEGRTSPLPAARETENETVLRVSDRSKTPSDRSADRFIQCGARPGVRGHVADALSDGMALPDLAVEETFESDERYGEFMGHNGSTMFHHQKRHIIVYAEPKPSIAGTVKPDTVLFRGWSVPNEVISGVAYTFKKGCDPAPYLVTGYGQRLIPAHLAR